MPFCSVSVDDHTSPKRALKPFFYSRRGYWGTMTPLTLCYCAKQLFTLLFLFEEYCTRVDAQSLISSKHTTSTLPVLKKYMAGCCLSASKHYLSWPLSSCQQRLMSYLFNFWYLEYCMDLLKPWVHIAFINHLIYDFLKMFPTLFRPIASLR